MEELKKEDATTFCFQFFGDNINLSNLTLTETERTINKIYSTKIGNNETNNINFNFISSLGNDVNAIEKQQIANSESNETLKGIPSDSEISNDENEISNRYFYY